MKLPAWFKENMVLGIIIAVVVLIVLIATGHSQKPIQQSPQYGRYQIFFSPHARADTYLVDTQTGKVWQSVLYEDMLGEPRIWVPYPRVNSEADLAQWLGSQVPKTKESK